jgi:hypothetical protein
MLRSERQRQVFQADELTQTGVRRPWARIFDALVHLRPIWLEEAGAGAQIGARASIAGPN